MRFCHAPVRATSSICPFHLKSVEVMFMEPREWDWNASMGIYTGHDRGVH